MPLREQPPDTGVYIYCVTEGEPQVTVPGVHPGGPVYSLARGNLCAVVSVVPLNEYGELPLADHLRDPEWANAAVHRHDRVVTEVMRGRPVLPFRFCTVTESEQAVKELVASHEVDFNRAMVRLRDREEWHLLMSYIPAAGSRRVQQANSAPLPQSPAPARRLVLAATTEDAQRVSEQLFVWADDVQLHTEEPALPHSGEVVPVLDAFCLVARPRLPWFARKLDELRHELAIRGYEFRLSGPFPPYHFVRETRGDEHLL